MKQHQYEIQVKHLSDAKGQPSTYPQALVFEVGNHDDIFKIVERIKSRGDLQGYEEAFALGLKLFSEVILENKDHPLFSEFKPHFMDFIKQLKKG